MITILEMDLIICPFAISPKCSSNMLLHVCIKSLHSLEVVKTYLQYKSIILAFFFEETYIGSIDN